MDTTVKPELASASESNEDVSSANDHSPRRDDTQDLEPQHEEASDGTPNTTNFDDQMRSYFARVKSKDAATKNATATPGISSSRDISEPQPELQSSDPTRNQHDEGSESGGTLLTTSLSPPPLSPAKPTTASQDQHREDDHQVSCTCDDYGSSCGNGNGHQQQRAELKKREPWWWVMQIGFSYLVYCVYCDFATAVQNGSQVSRLYNGGRGSGSSLIMFTSWWQFMRFILAMMCLGRCASSGAAWLAIAGRIEVAAAV